MQVHTRTLFSLLLGLLLPLYWFSLEEERQKKEEAAEAVLRLP